MSNTLAIRAAPYLWKRQRCNWSHMLHVCYIATILTKVVYDLGFDIQVRSYDFLSARSQASIQVSRGMIVIQGSYFLIISYHFLHLTGCVKIVGREHATFIISTHCCIVTPYGDIKLGQHCLRQAATWTTVDLSFVQSNLWYKPQIRQWNCWSRRCSWSITCRCCSNCIFILDLTLGFSGLSKDHCKTRRETFTCSARVRLYQRFDGKSLVISIWGHCYRRMWRYQFVKWNWKLHTQKSI